MSHLDDETLSLVALGDVPDDGAEEHLASCPVCHERLAELREVVDIGRSLAADDVDPPAPPPAVWDAIAAAIAGGAADAPDATGPPAASGTVAAPGAVGTSPAPVTPLGARPSRPPRRHRLGRAPVAALAVAAVVIVLAVVALVVVVGGSSPTVVDTVALDPLAPSEAHGRVELVVDGDRRELRVETGGLPAAPGDYYELWLLDDDVQQLVSLGPLEPDRRGVFVVPPGLDLDRLRVVDVSVEPLDGDPTHSGNSVLRGTLTA